MRSTTASQAFLQRLNQSVPGVSAIQPCYNGPQLYKNSTIYLQYKLHIYTVTFFLIRPRATAV
jgi:hypothetical protein